MDRRSFIQKTSLLTTSLFVSLKSYPLDLLTVDGVITGKVTSLGKGVGNVIVSDGFSVIPTDKNGDYSIKVNPKARFVWISTPSGYEFQTDGYVARHYETSEDKTTLNFELKALAVNDNRHNFIIWADPQVKSKADVKQMMDTSVPDVIQLVKEMGNIPVHGIGVGDLVWDNHALFPAYTKALNTMGIPFFQALGNHDMDYRLGDDETSDKTFQDFYGPTYYSFNRGKAHYVVLDDVRYLGVDRTYDGFIVQKQLDWLAKDLEYVDRNALLIINLHIPVHNAVKNRDELYKLLRRFKNVHIMSGHTHYNKNVITENVFEHNHGTVCGAWWTGPICGDGTPRGYGVYEVDGTDLKWYYKGTGLEKKEQVRVYVDELTKQKRIIANVWNYDPKWKVEYYLDGKLKGKMEIQKGYDPLSVTLYKGDELPKSRSFAEPTKNEHIFLAHCGPEVKNVKVVATDRFGEKFEVEYNG